MGPALLIARLLLAAVFAVAALAKLGDRRGARQALVDFGVPMALAPALAVLLPPSELAIAVALVVVPWAWYGAVGALALLGLFTAAIVVSLARGRRPDCHCFGQVSSGPIGWGTLVRNIILVSLAAFVVWAGRVNAGPSAVGWLGAMSIWDRILLLGGGALLVLVVAEAWVLLKLFTRHGQLLLRLEKVEEALAGRGGAVAPAAQQPTAVLPVGALAPGFTLSGVHGETLTLDALRAGGRPVLLLFSDPGCGPCLALMPEVGRWQREHASKLTFAVLSRGAAEQNRAKYGEHGATQVLLQKDHEVAEAYRVSGTPSAVLVRPDGTIGSAAAAGADAIRQLVAQVVGAPAAAASGNGGAPAAPSAARPGDPAPSVALPDLDGKTVKLRDYRGKATVVLVWNPGCGFCQQMVGDLKAWEESRESGAPDLLLVSAGDVAANRAMGLGCTVVLDQVFATGRAFGANGTPSAVLVDAEGKVASEVAVGRPAVLTLLGVAPATQEPMHPPAAPAANGTGRAEPPQRV